MITTTTTTTVVRCPNVFSFSQPNSKLNLTCEQFEGRRTKPSDSKVEFQKCSLLLKARQEHSKRQVVDVGDGAPPDLRFPSPLPTRICWSVIDDGNCAAARPRLPMSAFKELLRVSKRRLAQKLLPCSEALAIRLSGFENANTWACADEWQLCLRHAMAHQCMSSAAVELHLNCAAFCVWRSPFVPGQCACPGQLVCPRHLEHTYVCCCSRAKITPGYRSRGV